MSIKKDRQRAVRAVSADRSEELGQLGQYGELVTVYTATRAWRGGLVARTGEVVVLSSPTIVWVADEADVNGNRSRYFVRGTAPKGKTEEPSGARVVVIPVAGIVYVCAHGVPAPDSPPTVALDSDGYPLPGPAVLCHYCTVSHEFRGHLAELVPGEWLRLADDDEQAMVNEISDGHFARVLAGIETGVDHVRTAGIRLALHALTAIVVL